MFCEVMRDRGVEVFEAETLLAEALVKPEVKDWVCDHILNERQVGITASQRAREWVETADAGAGGRVPDRRDHQGRRASGTPGWRGSRPTRRPCCCRRCRTSCSSAIRRAGSSTG